MGGFMGFCNGIIMRFKSNKQVYLSNGEIVERGAKFLMHFRFLRDKFGVTNENIWNLDETSIFVDEDEDTTIEHVGAKSVFVKTAGLSKIRLIGICLASAAGQKKLPTIITKIERSSVTSKVSL
jgi:hypothetical protein